MSLVSGRMGIDAGIVFDASGSEGGGSPAGSYSVTKKPKYTIPSRHILGSFVIKDVFGDASVRLLQDSGKIETVMSSVNLGYHLLPHIMELQDTTYSNLSDDDKGFLYRKTEDEIREQFYSSVSNIGIVANRILVARSAIFCPNKEERPSHGLTGFYPENDRGHVSYGESADILDASGHIRVIEEHTQHEVIDYHSDFSLESMSVMGGVVTRPGRYRNHKLMNRMVHTWHDLEMREGKRNNLVAAIDLRNIASWKTFMNNGMNLIAATFQKDGTFRVYAHKDIANPQNNAPHAPVASCHWMDYSEVVDNIARKGLVATGTEKRKDSDGITQTYMLFSPSV
jgi:hypothetical protein